MKTQRLFLVPLLIAFVLFSAGTQFHATAQIFKVTPKTMGTSGNPGDYLDTFADVENLSASQSAIRIQVTSQTMPAGWSASFCMVNCFAPDAVDVEDILDPRMKVSFHITWATSTTPAEGSITYKLSSVSNPAETYTLTFTASTIKTSISEKAAPVRTLMLSQNYPNPFSLAKSTGDIMIGYSTIKSGIVTLKVYDLIGHEVATIVNEVQPAGMYRASWNGIDHRGSAVSPGIYVYKLMTGGTSLSRRLLITR